MNRLSYIIISLSLLFSKSAAAQTDTVPPHLVCRNVPYVQLGPLCMLQLFAADFIDSLSDDGSGVESFGMRKKCTGTGFPEHQTSVLLRGEEIGPLQLEIWARDSAGNTTTCSTGTIVTDLGNCDPSGAVLVLMAEKNQGVAGVTLGSQFIPCGGGQLQTLPYAIITDSTGYWSQLGAVLAHPGDFTMMPAFKGTNHANGVTTYDLLKIQKHILGTEPLATPAQIIAADANLDDKVTLQDVVLLQKLLLGLIPQLPHLHSWRFWPQDYQFPDPKNPFDPWLPELIVVKNEVDPAPNFFPFYGVKIGDVDFSADPKK